MNNPSMLPIPLVPLNEPIDYAVKVQERLRELGTWRPSGGWLHEELPKNDESRVG